MRNDAPLLSLSLGCAARSPPAGLARPGHLGSGDAHAAGDLAVALPERLLAGQERVMRVRLHLAVSVDGSRGDRVLAGGRRSPVVGPEGPSELTALAIVPEEGRGLPG